MLERLVLRPELGAFETNLRERMEKIASLEDERLARPRTMDREASSLVVVSEFVPGSRLSELLERSAELGHVPGVDAAVGLLLDMLPALCGLHAGGGFAHGTITPARTVLTPAGQIVLLDAIYGGALTQLRYGRRKLWQEFGVAAPDSHATPRLDVSADLTQAALAAAMLVLGRPLRTEEYLFGLSRVLKEVTETAQIRGTAAFAGGVQDFFDRALAFDPATSYTSADDALFDVRQLAAELGVQVCRRALVDFIEQMESPAGAPALAAAVQEPGSDEVAEEIASYGLDEEDWATGPSGQEEPDLDGGVDAELNLDSLVSDLPGDETIELGVSDADSVADEEDLDWIQLAAASTLEAGTDYSAVLEPVIGPASRDDDFLEGMPVAAPVPTTAGFSLDVPALDMAASSAAPEALDPTVVTADRGVHAPELDTVFGPTAFEAAAAVEEYPAQEPQAFAGATAMAPLTEPDASPLAGDNAPGTDVPPVRSRRAKRATRSVRARKDKLRSVTEADPPAVIPARPVVPPVPAAVAVTPAVPGPPSPLPEAQDTKKQTGTWLVAPDRAAAFEPVQVAPGFLGVDPITPPRGIPVPVNLPMSPASPTGSSPSIPVYAPPPPPIAVFSPPPPPPAIEPVFSRSVGAVAPSYSTPPSWTPPPVVPVVAPASQLTTARLKDPPRRPRTARPDPAVEIYATTSPVTTPDEPASFPWKLAAAAAVIMVVAIIGGRTYVPIRGAGNGSDPGPAARPAAQPTPAASLPTRSAPASVGATGGRLEIETQPAGARILIDGKPAGESPVLLDGIAPGRHTVTLISTSGTVKKAVRIEAGRTARLDIPIFSGWVGVYAPFVVTVVEGGRVIGTTEEPRILLSPGRHELRLLNRDLGYESVHSVDIEPGEVRSISIDPRGRVNLNATPWAEVWVDGRKAGDTPLANLQLPLGVRELTFKHPQFGERRATITVRGNGPAAVSIDMSRP